MCPSNVITQTQPITSPVANVLTNEQQVLTTPQPVTQVGEIEIGGREGPEPTRYGDWEKAGRCIDF